MSPQELTERMEKIRLQNEKIKERREVSLFHIILMWCEVNGALSM